MLTVDVPLANIRLLTGKKGAKKFTSKEKLKQLMSLVGVKDRPKIVDLTRKVGTAETLTESKIDCSTSEKDFYLYYFLQQHPGRTIVFCNSIDCVRRLVNLFGLLCTDPLGLHAQMHQKQRLKNLERFTANNEGFLIATDVAARGLDIPNVEHVVHYQVPRTSESYVHRSGRTARAKKEGLSVMLIGKVSHQHLFFKNWPLGRAVGLSIEFVCFDCQEVHYWVLPIFGPSNFEIIFWPILESFTIIEIFCGPFPSKRVS